MYKKFLFTTMVFGLTSFGVIANNFSLSSSDISEGNQLTENQVFSGFGCSGKNQSPQLSWDNVPKGTKSFVLTAYDPDAPTGSGWWHWVTFNIPANTNFLKTNASALEKMPKGAVQSVTDFGSFQFGGACPPAGEVHRYQFTLYALNVEKLELGKSASPALVGFMTKAHAIDSAKITAVYTRKK
jgi:Raf kinase inhibitor-like YbhB/YbcL family protein